MYDYTYIILYICLIGIWYAHLINCANNPMIPSDYRLRDGSSSDQMGSRHSINFTIFHVSVLSWTLFIVKNWHEPTMLIHFKALFLNAALPSPFFTIQPSCMTRLALSPSGAQETIQEFQWFGSTAPGSISCSSRLGEGGAMGCHGANPKISGKCCDIFMRNMLNWRFSFNPF